MADDLVERVKDAIEEALTDEQGVRIYDAARAATAECFKWRPIDDASPVSPGFKRLFSKNCALCLFLDIPEPSKENAP